MNFAQNLNYLEHVKKIQNTTLSFFEENKDNDCFLLCQFSLLRRGLAAFKNVKRPHPLFMASFIIQAELEKTEFNLSLSYENEPLRDFERTTSYLFQKILNSIQTFFVLHNVHFS